MNMELIFVIVVGLLFIVGGPIIGHYATKASHKDAEAEKNGKK